MKNEEQEDEVDYKQDLGLKKILYKYQNENQQLRSQIKALTQRLTSILQKPKQQKKATLNPIEQVQSKLMKEEMERLYKQINLQIQDLKCNKNAIDERHQSKCIQVQNKVAKEQKEIQVLKHKLTKYEHIDQGIILNSSIKNSRVLQIEPSLLNNKTLRSSTIRIQSYYQKYANLSDQLEATRKNIKALQRQRDQNDRTITKKHLQQIDTYHQNRNIQFGKQQQIQQVQEKRKRGGVWGMDYTQENYKMIKDQIKQLKKQRQIKLNSIKNQNIVLSNKINELLSELDTVHKSVQIPPLPHMKRGALNTTPLLNLSTSRYVDSPLRKSVKLDIGPSQFQRNNDKNYVPKKPRKVQWQSSKSKSGIQWNDSNVKSPITGMNLWLDGCLLGVQFLHTMGDSSQHLHLMSKKVTPIQYRLSSNDCVQNIILYLSDSLICGIQMNSKNGRVDSFGNKKGKKFDFGIKKAQKPVFSFGQFQVTNNNSEITKLGFQVI